MSRETSSRGFDPAAPTADAIARITLDRRPVKVTETVRRNGEDNRDDKQKLRWGQLSESYKEAYESLPEGNAQRESMRVLLQALDRLGPTMKTLLSAYMPNDSTEQLDLELLANSKAYREALEVESGSTLPPEVDEYVRTVYQLKQFKQEIEQQYVAKGLAQPAAVRDNVAPSGEYMSENWKEPSQAAIDANQLARLREELAGSRESLPVNDITIQALEGMIQEAQGIADEQEREQQVAELTTQAAEMMATMTKEDVDSPLYNRLVAAQIDLAVMQE